LTSRKLGVCDSAQVDLYGCSTSGKVVDRVRFNKDIAMNRAIRLKGKLGYKCPKSVYCKKEYQHFEIGKVNGHIAKVHKQRKNFRCNLTVLNNNNIKCGFETTSAHNLKFHKTSRIHYNLRPYVCPCCDQNFTIPSHRNEHMLKQHKNKGWPCGMCKDRLMSMDDLKRHNKSEHPHGIRWRKSLATAEAPTALPDNYQLK
jgi:hypothetical protein